MLDAITGWLGLVVLVAAGALALAADAVRQSGRPAGSRTRGWSRRDRWVVGLGTGAVVLALLGAAATAVRFVTSVT